MSKDRSLDSSGTSPTSNTTSEPASPTHTPITAPSEATTATRTIKDIIEDTIHSYKNELNPISLSLGLLKSSKTKENKEVMDKLQQLNDIYDVAYTEAKKEIANPSSEDMGLLKAKHRVFVENVIKVAKELEALNNSDKTIDSKTLKKLIKYANDAKDFLEGKPKPCKTETLVKDLQKIPMIKGNRLNIEIKPPELKSNILKGEHAAFVKDIIKNCVLNSDKFMTAGHIDVLITKEEGALIISIKDNGPGMEPAVLNKVRAGTMVTTGGQGRGLFGLHQRLMEYKGEKTVHSSTSVDHGTTFIWKLPAAEHLFEHEPSPETATASIPLKAKATTRTEHKTIEKSVSGKIFKIIIVDDNPVNAKLLKRTIDNKIPKDCKNIECLTVHNPKDAFELYNQQYTNSEHIQVIGMVIDKHMPSGPWLRGEYASREGYDLANRIRADESTAKTVRIPMFLYSGDEDLEHEYKEGGFDKLVGKGSPPTVFNLLVEFALEARRVKEAATIATSVSTTLLPESKVSVATGTGIFATAPTAAPTKTSVTTEIQKDRKRKLKPGGSDDEE